MKTSHAIGLAAAAVMITVAIEESRIAALRSGGKPGETILTSRPMSTLAGSSSPMDEPVRAKKRAELKPAAPDKAPAAMEESFARTARKMWENPAGKSMMNQGVKVAVAMLYEDFIDGLDLSEEEEDYFKTLLGKEISGQQELGMKMISATPGEREALAEEMAERGKTTEEEIKTFLNNGEDYRKLTDYKSRMPERQQLDGIRMAMETKGAPLDADTETRLLDAMHKVRTETKAPDLSGPGAMSDLANGNLVAEYEQSWRRQQDALHLETATILSPAQLEAFQEYQNQVKEMQLMSLKMAEQMMKSGESGGE